MADATTTVVELQSRIKQFRDERDWEQFHDPKNLAEGLIIEAGELLEHFLWRTKEQVAESLHDASYKEEVADELADVLNFVLLLSVALDVDLSDATERKIAKTSQKYPIEKSKGSATKYTKL